MKRFDKVRAYAAVVTMIAAVGIWARAQTNHFDTPGGIAVVASTVPANGDVNPYGVARVPDSKGSLIKGNILVSNFNDNANLQVQAQR